MNTAGLFPQSIHISHTKKRLHRSRLFTLVPITKVFGGGGVGFGEGRRKPFFRKVPPPLPNLHNQLILLDEVFAVAADTEAVQLDEAGGVLVVIGGAFLKGGEVGAVQGILGFAADGPRVALVELQAHGT